MLASVSGSFLMVPFHKIAQSFVTVLLKSVAPLITVSSDMPARV